MYRAVLTSSNCGTDAYRLVHSNLLISTKYDKSYSLWTTITNNRRLPMSVLLRIPFCYVIFLVITQDVFSINSVLFNFFVVSTNISPFNHHCIELNPVKDVAFHTGLLLQWGAERASYSLTTHSVCNNLSRVSPALGAWELRASLSCCCRKGV